MRTDVLGVGFDDLSMEQALDRAEELIAARSGAYVVTPNPEIVMLCRENENARRAVTGADLVLADGIGIIHGARILGTPIQEKVSGVDFASRLMERLAARGGSAYFFGARPGVAECAARNMQEKYPGLVVAGTHDGYFTDDVPIAEEIRAAGPDLLLVCLGAPKQELWMEKWRGKLNTGLMAGLGGSLDVYAGVVKRAPELWQRLGLEWFYRLCREPKRLGRMLCIPKFLALTALRGRKNDAGA